MDWTKRQRSGSRTYHRAGWVVKYLKVAKCWLVTYKTRTVPDCTFPESASARQWVDHSPQAQQFAADVLRMELDPKHKENAQ
jgi:hypothetical protein